MSPGIGLAMEHSEIDPIKAFASGYLSWECPSSSVITTSSIVLCDMTCHAGTPVLHRLFERLHAEGRTDRLLHEILSWYAALSSLRRFGAFGLSFPLRTSGGVPYAQLPPAEWRPQADEDLRWALRFVPVTLQRIFVPLMDHHVRPRDLALRLWPQDARGQHRVESLFLIAANHILLGGGHHCRTL